MNNFLLDASALSKRYFAEPGALLVDHLFANVSKHRLACLMLGAAEVTAALVRKRNGGLITLGPFATAIAKLRAEVLDAADFAKYAADNTLVRKAIDLLPNYAINSSDAVLLQVALELASYERRRGNDLILVASDQRLLKAAQAEGLIAFDPESQTQADLDALIGP